VALIQILVFCLVRLCCVFGKYQTFGWTLPSFDKIKRRLDPENHALKSQLFCVSHFQFCISFLKAVCTIYLIGIYELWYRRRVLSIKVRLKDSNFRHRD